MRETVTSSVLLDPIDELGDASVDARLVRLSTQAAPANDTMQPPTVVDFTDQRTAGVAAARVLTASLVPAAHHVLLDSAAVEGPLAAHCLRYDRNGDLSQYWRLIAGHCTQYNARHGQSSWKLNTELTDWSRNGPQTYDLEHVSRVGLCSG